MRQLIRRRNKSIKSLQGRRAACRDPDDLSHCRILSPDKTEWRLILATLCGWKRCFMADQLWLMKRIREEDTIYNNNKNFDMQQLTGTVTMACVAITGWQCKILWQFPDGSRHSSVALGMLSVTHIMPVLVLLSVVGVAIQQYMIQNHILNI